MPHAVVPKAARTTRVDELLVERGEAPDIKTARALILAGRVHSDGRRYSQAGPSNRPRCHPEREGNQIVRLSGRRETGVSTQRLADSHVCTHLP